MKLPIENPALRAVLKAIRHPIQKILLRGVYRRIEQMEYRSANLRRNRVSLSRVKTVKGWFNETLIGQIAASHGVDRIAVAWIDCDLYESTVPVLDYLTGRIGSGSVILFDDWRCFRNLPDFGQQRAVREWLDRNPGLALQELLSFGWNGAAFTVQEC